MLRRWLDSLIIIWEYNWMPRAIWVLPLSTCPTIPKRSPDVLELDPPVPPFAQLKGRFARPTMHTNNRTMACRGWNTVSFDTLELKDKARKEGFFVGGYSGWGWISQESFSSPHLQYSIFEILKGGLGGEGCTSEIIFNPPIWKGDNLLLLQCLHWPKKWPK